MQGIVDWWKNYLPLTENEKILYEPSRKPLDGEFSQTLNDRFMSHLIGNVPQDYLVRMSSCATNLIDELFAKYVDDDTLVVSTDLEHPNVRENLKKVPHLLTLKVNDCTFQNQEAIAQVLNEAINHKRVFLYFIGMTNQGLSETSMMFHAKLKTLLTKTGIEHVYVYDDVQGMFYLPRDYSIFDFVIGTAHAAVHKFELGFILYRQSFKGWVPGEFSRKGLALYLPALETVLMRREKVNIFDYVLRAYYSRFPQVRFDQPVATFRSVFTAPVSLDFENGVNYFKDGDVAYCTPDEVFAETQTRQFSLRAHPYIIFPDILEHDIKKLDDLFLAQL